jgi:branched-chain amino acid aminotransferase
MTSSLDPNLVVFFAGDYRPLGEAKVGLLTHALQYGSGVFEGIRAYWSEEDQELYLFRPREHYDRWKANAGLLKMEIPMSALELCEVTRELMVRNHFRTDVYIRPFVYRSREGIGVGFSPETDFAIVALPFDKYMDSSQGLRAGVSTWRRISDNAIPARGKISGAYVNSALASDEARANGFDEAIVLTEDGHVAEASAANIFLVRNGHLVTPPVNDEILEGITRATVIDLAREMWVDTIERRVDRTELYIAEEVFFVGTAFEIAPVIEIDHRPVGRGTIGPLTNRLRQAYQDVARGRTTRDSHWRMPVYRTVAEMAFT